MKHTHKRNAAHKENAMKISQSISDAIATIGCECESDFYVTPKEEREEILQALANLIVLVTIGHENVSLNEAGTVGDIRKNSGRYEIAYRNLPKQCQW